MEDTSAIYMQQCETLEQYIQIFRMSYSNATIVVERPITGPTPHRSGRAELPHRAFGLFSYISARVNHHAPSTSQHE